MARYVVDTHALLFYLADSSKLGAAVDAALNDPNSELILPAIAWAEAFWIVSSRNLGLTTTDLRVAIDSDSRVTVSPLTREIVERAHALSAISEMHDRQIAATAMALADAGLPVTLLTKDADIVASGIVTTAW